MQQVTQGVYLIDGQEVPNLKEKQGICGVQTIESTKKVSCAVRHDII